jgi:uncharacterized protein
MGLSEDTLYTRYLDDEVKEKAALNFIKSSECTLEMINYEDPNGFTPLCMAARFNSHKVVKALIDKGADINYVTTIYEMNALICAIAEGKYEPEDGSKEANLKVVELLINAGTNVDFKSNSYSAFVLACRCNKTEVVKLLLNHDIDINFKDSYQKKGMDYLKQEKNKEGIKLVQSYILNKSLQKELFINSSENKKPKI